MPDSAEERPFFLSEETWQLIQLRRDEAASRWRIDHACLVNPTADQIAGLSARLTVEWLEAYAILALAKICCLTQLAPFLQCLAEERRRLIDVAMPVIAKQIQHVSSSGTTASFVSQFKLLVDAECNKWEAKGRLKVSEQVRRGQEPIAEILKPWISRLTQDPSIETGSVPDLAIEGNSPADPKAKAIESGDNRQGAHDRGKQYPTAQAHNIARLSRECGLGVRALERETAIDKSLIRGHLRGKNISDKNVDVYAATFTRLLKREVTADEIRGITSAP
jgi:hypothetical protein